MIKLTLKRSKITWVDIFSFLTPFLLSVLAFYLLGNVEIIGIELKGLGEILASMISFTSIIIGVLMALFCVIVSIQDSDVMKKLRENGGDKLLFGFSFETLMSNIILLILSLVLQVVKEYLRAEWVIKWGDFLVLLWVSISIYVLLSSIRTVYYLLILSMFQKDKTLRPETEGISQEDEEKLKDRYSKT